MPSRPPIVVPYAGLQPELYISSDAAVAEIWGPPGPPIVICATCGRPKAAAGQTLPDMCGPTCDGYLDHPWPDWMHHGS